MPVGAALLHARLLTMLAFATPPLAEMGQVLQADQAVRGGVHALPADDVVAILLQPSRSSGQHDEPSGGRGSAFLLHALPQPGSVVRFGAGRCAREKRRSVLRVGGHRQKRWPTSTPTT